MISFISIVQQGSFSRAASKLGYSQAAITIQIRNLEEELGVRLFDRLGRNITLTNSGEIFYEKIIPVLNGLTQAREAVRESTELDGTLTIGCTDSISMSLLPDLVREYHARYPGVIIRVETDSIDGLLRMIDRNDADFVYLVDKKIQGPHWRTIHACESRVRFMVGKDHDLSGRQGLLLKDLLDYPFLLTEQDASYRQLLDQELLERGMRIRPAIEAKNTEFILDMVAKNMGISFLPEYLLEDVDRWKDIRILDVRDIDVSVYLQLICHQNKWVSEEMNAFFEMFCVK